ncbi:MAG: hypothetical protein ABIJ10_03580 [Candidatus Micrarchaeota archaeon]
MNKKGFLFVVTIFLILTYIILSVSVWVKSIEASERAYAEFYKESTIELAISQITHAKLDNVTRSIMFRSLFRLNEHTMNVPLAQGPEDDETRNLRGAFRELLVNGSANDSYFIGPGIPVEDSSLSAWASNLNSSLLAIGSHLSRLDVYDFNVSQSDIDKVNYTFNVRLEITDNSNLSSVSRVYTISNELEISGFVDPVLTRESSAYGSDNAFYRQFYFNKDQYESNLEVDVIPVVESGDILGGQGWLYGYLVSPDNADSLSSQDRHNFILVGDFDDIVAVADYDSFAGYILTNAPGEGDDCVEGGVHSESDTFNPIGFESARGGGAACGDMEINCGAGACTGNPFIVAPDFHIDNAGLCRFLNGTGTSSKHCALFINMHTYEEVISHPRDKLDVDEDHTGIYNIEEMRDFVMCGYYTHNPAAPSYLQRLLEDSYSRNSDEFGIETFVIGEYASDDDIYDTYSRLDRELFSGSEGIRIRGFTGCKDYATCAVSDEPPSTGIFVVSEDVIIDYGLDAIECRAGAGCE